MHDFFEGIERPWLIGHFGLSTLCNFIMLVLQVTLMKQCLFLPVVY